MSSTEGGTHAPFEPRGAKKRSSVRLRLGLALLVPLTATGTFLVSSTHHRPLGAVTFATLLVLVVFVSEIALFRRVH